MESGLRIMPRVIPTEAWLEVKRPYRDTVRHLACGTLSAVAPLSARRWQRDPRAFTTCYCARCKADLPVSEFVWDRDGVPVGS